MAYDEPSLRPRGRIFVESSAPWACGSSDDAATFSGYPEWWRV